MRIEYKIISIKHARTPGILRAKVLEKSIANSLDRALGRVDSTRESDWVGHTNWHEADNSAHRANKKLAHLLAANNHLINAVEEKVKCRLPKLSISFGHKFA